MDNKATGQILHLKSIDDFNNINNPDTKIIIKVGADWCEPCKKITPLYTQFAENNNNSNIIYAEINSTDADEELLDFIEVRSLPTFIFYDNKKITNRIIGSDKMELSEYINSLYI
jgi:thiol-disulfide isomerase/thioredoxin